MNLDTRKVAIITMGCRVNQSESSVIEGTLKQHGIEMVGVEDSPDICIINTCTVTGRSDANSRQLIRKAARTGAEIIVTGCYSELNRETVLRMPGVSSVYPSDRKEKIIDHILRVGDVGISYNLYNRARPYLKVQDGCNFNCSYCAVPHARGRSRSISVTHAVSRARQIEENGYKEIVLTGIHLGSYGHDLMQKVNLAYLLREILKGTDSVRIRLSSIEINEIDDELLDLLSEPRICDHLHLPLQHGSDRILKLMNRNYTAERYTEKINRIAGLDRHIAIGTDIIAGFPTETDSDHQATIALADELPFAYMHIFPFSVRSGTAAAGLKPQLQNNLISSRAAGLRSLASKKKSEYISKQTGRILDIIMEEDGGRDGIIGTSSNYLKIPVQACNLKRGSSVFVKLLGVSENAVQSILINCP